MIRDSFKEIVNDDIIMLAIAQIFFGTVSLLTLGLVVFLW